MNAGGEALREAEADAGWPELVVFLKIAGLKDGPLERVLTLLAAEDVTNLSVLRRSFSALAPGPCKPAALRRVPISSSAILLPRHLKAWKEVIIMVGSLYGIPN